MTGTPHSQHIAKLESRIAKVSHDDKTILP